MRQILSRRRSGHYFQPRQLDRSHCGGGFEEEWCLQSQQALRCDHLGRHVSRVMLLRHGIILYDAMVMISFVSHPALLFGLCFAVVWFVCPGVRLSVHLYIRIYIYICIYIYFSFLDR